MPPKKHEGDLLMEVTASPTLESAAILSAIDGMSNKRFNSLEAVLQASEATLTKHDSRLSAVEVLASDHDNRLAALEEVEVDHAHRLEGQAANGAN